MDCKVRYAGTCYPYVDAAMTGNRRRAQLRPKQCLLCVEAVLYADERTSRLVSRKEELFVPASSLKVPADSTNPWNTGG